MNTNGGWPDIVERLAQAGIDSFRFSLNSAQETWYERYYRPRNYNFADVRESIRRAVALGKWASINYFTLPGFTDQPTEYAALQQLIAQTGLHMIQWRNFNIDPDWYADRMNITPDTVEEPLGILSIMRGLKEQFPFLHYGYFNPTAVTISKKRSSPSRSTLCLSRDTE
jgi:MoaA/NifB/PqqE/SkfB family radical SAM enzyme